MQILARLAQSFSRPAAPAFEPRLARGVADRSNPGVRCIVVRVDAPTFERISRGAKTSGVSVTEAIRQLLKRGLDAGATPGGL